MKLTETLNQDIRKFEKTTGKTVSPKLRDLISELVVAGDQFEDLGAKDAREGCPQRTKEDFVTWGRRELKDLEGEDNPIVDLMHKCYIDGYNAAALEVLA